MYRVCETHARFGPWDNYIGSTTSPVAGLPCYETLEMAWKVARRLDAETFGDEPDDGFWFEVRDAVTLAPVRLPRRQDDWEDIPF